MAEDSPIITHLKILPMKTLKLLCLTIFAIFASCSTDDGNTAADELQGLSMAREIGNDTHIIELYTPTGAFEQGYNPITIRIKDKTTGQYVTDAQISWMPIMHMTSMQHSCPFSTPEKTTGKETLYDGYIVFQMAENATEYWTIDINYTIGGITYSATGQIDVPASSNQRVASFLGADGNRYVAALVEPTEPSVGLNEMTAVVYKMVSMMNYVPADGFTIKIDPRMPGMGNHGSPNNVDLTQTGNFYGGTLSLTMTGYWKINLQVLDQDNQVLKGEAVTDANPESSLYFEVEF